MADQGNCDEQLIEDEEITLYRKDANIAVTFRIIYDTENYLSFKPVMSHQIFGENESIFGYRSLNITLSYLHNSARCFVNIESSGEIKSDDHKPDDIMDSLNPWLPENYVSTEKEFLNMLSTEKHDTIEGTLLHEFRDKSRSNMFPNEEVYSLYKITHCHLNDDNFKTLHSRFETFVIWYIDGANFIDLDDEKWEIFYVYEEFTHPKNGLVYTTPVGFCTVYKFFAHPDNIRSRISQFFVLPSHQRRGIGTELYKTVFKFFQSKNEVVDITVEQPTTDFQTLRDIHDSSLLIKTLKQDNIKILKYPPKKIFNSLKDLKICKKQSQRVYDIVSGLDASSNSEFYRLYLENLRKKFEASTKVTEAKKIRVGKRTFDVEDEPGFDETEYKKYEEELETCIKYLKEKFIA